MTTSLSLIGRDWMNVLDGIQCNELENSNCFKPILKERRHHLSYHDDKRSENDAKTLKQEQQRIFGCYPEKDLFYTVICSVCSMVILPQMLNDHMEKRHSSLLSSNAKKISMNTLIGQEWGNILNLIKCNFIPNGDSFDVDEDVEVQEDISNFTETDLFSCVVCSICSMILLPRMFKQHMDKRHSDLGKIIHMMNVKPILDVNIRSKTKYKIDEGMCMRTKAKKEDVEEVIVKDELLVKCEGGEATKRLFIKYDEMIQPVTLKQKHLIQWSSDPPEPVETSKTPECDLDDVTWQTSHPKPLAVNTFNCRHVGGLMSNNRKLDSLRRQLQKFWDSPVGNYRNNCNDMYYTQTNNFKTNMKPICKSSGVKRKRRPDESLMLQNCNNLVPNILPRLTTSSSPSTNPSTYIKLDLLINEIQK